MSFKRSLFNLFTFHLLLKNTISFQVPINVLHYDSRCPSSALNFRASDQSFTRHNIVLNAFVKRFFRRQEREKPPNQGNNVTTTKSNSTRKSFLPKKEKAKKRSSVITPPERVSICIIGGGVSGLTAALTASKYLPEGESIMLLESGESIGGRVQSARTEDGYVLDRGFAVFIEEYPMAKKILDYGQLNLGKFLPGALVKVDDEVELVRVADPLRQPEELFTALFAPVGSFSDKFSLLQLIFDIRSKSITEIFDEPETDTLSLLQKKWGFSDSILDRFFKPFLEGIYLAPLQEQSSRMFSFVFKMFSEGAATLPEGGMGAVAEQLAIKVANAGVDVRLEQPVSSINITDDGFVLQTHSGTTTIQAKKVIMATDGEVAQNLLAQLEGFNTLKTLPQQAQRSVGCLYYGFEGPPPVKDPILILNGIGDKRGGKSNPVNNACFPSVVNKGYAPDGCSLCSVTILKDAMDAYEGRETELDDAVRKQLTTWFPGSEYDIMKRWELKRIYKIPNAQPAQLKGPFPANVYGGRDCSTFLGMKLPDGMFICGDHMATATLNGALESGANAGMAAASN